MLFWTPVYTAELDKQQTGQQHESWCQPSVWVWDQIMEPMKKATLRGASCTSWWENPTEVIFSIKSLFKSGMFPLWVPTESAKSFALVYFATFSEESCLQVVLRGSIAVPYSQISLANRDGVHIILLAGIAVILQPWMVFPSIFPR